MLEDDSMDSDSMDSELETQEEEDVRELSPFQANVTSALNSQSHQRNWGGTEGEPRVGEGCRVRRGVRVGGDLSRWASRWLQDQTGRLIKNLHLGLSSGLFGAEMLRAAGGMDIRCLCPGCAVSSWGEDVR